MEDILENFSKMNQVRKFVIKKFLANDKNFLMCLIRFGARDLGLSHRPVDAPAFLYRRKTPTPPKKGAIWYHGGKLAPD